MKFKDISGMTEVELRKRTLEKREELFETKMKNNLGQVGNPLKIREIRREIAQLETAVTQKKPGNKSVEVKNG